MLILNLAPPTPATFSIRNFYFRHKILYIFFLYNFFFSLKDEKNSSMALEKMAPVGSDGGDAGRERRRRRDWRPATKTTDSTEHHWSRLQTSAPGYEHHLTEKRRPEPKRACGHFAGHRPVLTHRNPTGSGGRLFTHTSGKIQLKWSERVEPSPFVICHLGRRPSDNVPAD